MSNYDEIVPIPSKEAMNRGLSSAREDTMLQLFGTPGPLTSECGPPSPELKEHLLTDDVEPLRVTGYRFAVESLRQVLAEAKLDMPLVLSELKTAGMFCVRSRRHNPARYSNHSWGTAIDLYFGEAVVPQGVSACHRGLALIFPYFNRLGWYWGAEFSGDSVDSMHFELAEETVLKQERIREVSAKAGTSIFATKVISKAKRTKSRSKN